MKDPWLQPVAVSLKLPLKSESEWKWATGIWNMGGDTSLPLALRRMAISFLRRQGISVTAGGGSNNKRQGVALGNNRNNKNKPKINHDNLWNTKVEGSNKQQKNQKANLNGDDDEVAALILNDRRGWAHKGVGISREKELGRGQDKSGNGCGHTQDNK